MLLQAKSLSLVGSDDGVRVRPHGGTWLLNLIQFPRAVRSQKKSLFALLMMLFTAMSLSQAGF